MRIPIGSLLRKAFGFLVPIIVEEVEKAVEQRIEKRAVPSRTTIAEPVPFRPDPPQSAA